MRYTTWRELALPAGTYVTTHFGDDAQIAHSALADLGVTSLTIDYEGGGDEGHAELVSARCGEQQLSRSELISLALTSDTLSYTPPLEQYLANYRITYEGDRERYSRAHVWCIGNPDTVAYNRLRDLAYELACALLGWGFGNGDYSIHGSFEVNLEGRTINEL